MGSSSIALVLGVGPIVVAAGILLIGFGVWGILRDGGRRRDWPALQGRVTHVHSGRGGSKAQSPTIAWVDPASGATRTRQFSSASARNVTPGQRITLRHAPGDPDRVVLVDQGSGSARGHRRLVAWGIMTLLVGAALAVFAL